MAKKPPMSAPNLLDNAQSYNALASSAVQHGALATATEPAFYLLICYCIELSLKAICLHAEMAENTVKSIGHDLHEAYMAAAAVGGVPRIQTNAGRLVIELNAYHLQHVFRYTPSVPTLTVPDPTWCLQAVRDLLDCATSFCARPINRSWPP